MKLQNEPKFDIKASDMKDGQIGIITSWSLKPYIGRIVQRSNNMLIALQKPYGDCFNSIVDDETCRVRILQKGEILIIE